MSLLLVAGGLLLTIAGLAGCFLPVLPGPPLNWLALVLVGWARDWEPFGALFLVVWGAVAAAVTLLDFVVPAWGARRAGASRLAVWGSVVGMIIGIVWFPPFGMLLGALLGAVLGELVRGRPLGHSLRAGGGVFLGTTLGIVLKLAASGAMTWYFLAAAFSRA
jgi:uncharacterized protein YqgC (DUF456 family)